MRNKKNLIPSSERSAEELRQISIEGGIASGKKRREKKAAAELMKLLLNLPLSELQSKDKALFDSIGIKDTDNHIQLMVMLFAVLRKAFKGDMNAVKMALMLAGQMPAEKQEVTGANGSPLTIPDIAIKFTDGGAE